MQEHVPILNYILMYVLDQVFCFFVSFVNFGYGCAAEVWTKVSVLIRRISSKCSEPYVNFNHFNYVHFVFACTFPNHSKSAFADSLLQLEVPRAYRTVTDLLLAFFAFFPTDIVRVKQGGCAKWGKWGHNTSLILCLATPKLQRGQLL